MSTDRSEYRDCIIEIRLLEEEGGRWQGDWAVFEKEPFLAVAAGLLAVPGDTPAAAQAAAWRGAARWVDAYLSESSAGMVAGTTASAESRE